MPSSPLRPHISAATFDLTLVFHIETFATTVIIMRSSTILIAALATTATAFSPIASRPSSTSLAATTRKDFIAAATAAVMSSAVLPALAEDTVSIEIKKKGDGPKPDRGELAAIRFAAFTGGNKIDDIFDNPEPYYTRIGTGGLLAVRNITRSITPGSIYYS